jgi:hypothetical protein
MFLMAWDLVCGRGNLPYAPRMQRSVVLAAAIVLMAFGCEDANPPGSPTPGGAPPRVVIVFVGATARRTDLPSSAQACVNGVGATHIHPSWRNFAAISLQPIPPDHYEIIFTDVPLNTRVSFRINDQNHCDENPTGAVTRNVLANDVRLIQNTTTPGSGDEPGFAFTLASDGSISQ